MNIVVKPNIDAASDDVSKLLFQIFISITDAEKSVSIQEVRRFLAMIEETDWAENDDLRKGLLALREKYPSLWASYEDGALPASSAAVSQSLDLVFQRIGVVRGKALSQALTAFIDRLDRSLYRTKLMHGGRGPRAKVRQELLSVVTLERSGLAGESAGTIFRPVAPAPFPAVLPAAAPMPSIAPIPAAVPVVQPAVPGGQPRQIAPIIPPTVWPAAQLSPSSAQPWAGGKTKVRCVSVVRETHDTKTYTFQADPLTLFHYKPGQFVTIEVPIAETTLRRSYTISSTPSRPYALSITVKKVPMGWMSNWLFDNMAEGFECTINGPSGKFSCVDHPAEKLLFVAAGSGVTPTMSMLRWLVDTATAADVVFINKVRTPDDIIFHQELLHLSNMMGSRMRLVVVPTSNPNSRAWHGHMGPLDERLLSFYAPDLIEREAFVCGPSQFMKAVQKLLESLGHPPHRYHSESFGAATTTRKESSPAAGASQPSAAPRVPIGTTGVLAAAAPSQSPAKAPASQGAGRITIEGSGASFNIARDQTILEAAEEAGVNLEHSCRSGICGTCKMRKVSGDVRMSDSSLLSEGEIAEGCILTCVATATGSVTLAG